VRLPSAGSIEKPKNTLLASMSACTVAYRKPPEASTARLLHPATPFKRTLLNFRVTSASVFVTAKGVRERRLGCDAIRAAWRWALRRSFGTAETVP
jgi:hypothetical protein